MYFIIYLVKFFLFSTYTVMVALFMVTSVVNNNYALNFNISMPLHMIFRAVSLVYSCSGMHEIMPQAPHCYLDNSRSPYWIVFRATRGYLCRLLNNLTSSFMLFPNFFLVNQNTSGPLVLSLVFLSPILIYNMQSWFHYSIKRHHSWCGYTGVDISSWWLLIMISDWTDDIAGFMPCWNILLPGTHGCAIFLDKWTTEPTLVVIQWRAQPVFETIIGYNLLGIPHRECLMVLSEFFFFVIFFLSPAGAIGPGTGDIATPPSVCPSVRPSRFRTVTQKRIAVFSRNFAGTCTKSWWCAVYFLILMEWCVNFVWIF